MSTAKLKQGDTLELMATLPDKCVDMILCDLPYGTTACKWDTVIPFEPLWAQYKRLIKSNGAIVLFGNEPFTSLMICSNLKGFKYRWDWNKKIPSGMSYARFRPMQQTEDIAVFTLSGEPTLYNPQLVLRDKPIKSGGVKPSESAPIAIKDPNFKKTYDYKQPVTLLEFDKIRKGSLHPTQKPVALCEYLIKTYTNEDMWVLDNTMGSGTTGVACMNTNRNFIGIERDDKYFAIAKARIEEVRELKNQPLIK